MKQSEIAARANSMTAEDQEIFLSVSDRIAMGGSMYPPLTQADYRASRLTWQAMVADALI